MPSVPLSTSPVRSSNDNSISQTPLPPLLHTPGGLAIVEIQGDIKFSGVYEAGAGSQSVEIGRLVFPNLDVSSPDASKEEGAWMKKVQFLYESAFY